MIVPYKKDYNRIMVMLCRAMVVEADVAAGSGGADPDDDDDVVDGCYMTTSSHFLD